MDPVTLGFYAIVCACLSYAAPKLGAPWMRFGVGAVVGMVAATILPVARELLGLGY